MADQLIVDCAQQTVVVQPLTGAALDAYMAQQASGALHASALDAQAQQRAADAALLRTAAQQGGANGHDQQLWAALARLLGLL